PVNTGWNTEDARVFILPSTGPTTAVSGVNYPVYLDSNLVNSFEINDQRKTNWIGKVTPTPPGTKTYYYPFKYKSATQNASVIEYNMMLRLAEQYLIRSEARAEQNNISGAQGDLNVIRNRAGLLSTTANDIASLLSAILLERRHELFTEWGHRWLDLKRTGNADAVMDLACPSKGGTWNTYWQLYPLPSYDLLQDPNLTQNSGY
ncbi:MAG TPA: RagB/SusD family nutrient uptake outer membrane protein, partial [Chitinophagaceae bacterium]|nr:RagB/SusD family nutrient uptake outer membrane protein [Chitinophagaceae bacterium]